MSDVTKKILDLRQYIERKARNKPLAKEDANFMHGLLDLIEGLYMEVEVDKKERDNSPFIDPTDGGPSTFSRG